jgi:hypothetical protein
MSETQHLKGIPYGVCEQNRLQFFHVNFFTTLTPPSCQPILAKFVKVSETAGAASQQGYLTLPI